MQLEGTSSGDEQTLRPDAVSPEQTITPDDFETPSIPEEESPFEMPDENEAKPIIDKVDDTPVRRPASVIAAPPQK